MSAEKHFVVIGLGSFGTALARRLCQNGCRVTGMDANRERVEALKDILYEAVIGDATDSDTFRHLPIAQANAVLISLGEDIVRSVLATLHVKESQAKRIFVKGVTKDHGKILQHLGVERVVFPEIEVARELADRMTWPNVLDLIPIDPDYSMFEMAVPDSFVGKTLGELDLRRKYNAVIVGVKDVISNKLELFPDGAFRFNSSQLLLVVGRHGDLGELREL